MDVFSASLKIWWTNFPWTNFPSGPFYCGRFCRGPFSHGRIFRGRFYRIPVIVVKYGLYDSDMTVRCSAVGMCVG